MFGRRVAALLVLAVSVTLAWLPAGAAETTAPAPAPAAAPAAPATPAPPTTATAPHSLSLEDAVGTAVRNNPTVAIAEQDVAASKGLTEQATALLLPNLSGTISRTTPVNVPADSFQSNETTWRSSFALTQPLYTWGALSKGAKAARLVLTSAQRSYLRTQDQVAYITRQAYYQVLTSQEALRVEQDVLAAAQEHLRVAQLRFDAGVAPQYDVLAAETRVAQVQQSLASAQGGVSISWAGLTRVMGVELAPDTVLTSPRPLAVTTGDLSGLITEATEHRADIEAARAQVAVQEARVAIARTGNLPRISAVVSYSFLPSTAIAGVGPGGGNLVVSQDSGSIALTATWEMFTGGSVHGAVMETKARAQQARENVRLLQLQAEQDVRNAYYGITTAQAQVLAAEKQVAQAQEAYRIAQVRYQEGVSTSVEVLDAQTNLGDARNNLNNAIFALNLAVAQLDLAIGRGATGVPQ